MTLTTYKKWLYLKEGDAIKLNDGSIWFYRDYEHMNEGIVELYLMRNPDETEEHDHIKVPVHKEALIPVICKSEEVKGREIPEKKGRMKPPINRGGTGTGRGC